MRVQGGRALGIVVDDAEVLQVGVSVADGAVEDDEAKELEALLCNMSSATETLEVRHGNQTARATFRVNNCSAQACTECQGHKHWRRSFELPNFGDIDSATSAPSCEVDSFMMIG